MAKKATHQPNVTQTEFAERLGWTRARLNERKSDLRRADTRVIAGSGNVFIDLGFGEAEARVMALRVELMMRLREKG
jgi:hypothetical protein